MIGTVLVWVIIAAWVGIIAAAGLVWRMGIRKNVNRTVCMCIGGALILLCFLSVWGAPIAAYAFMRDAHYYGLYGHGDPARLSRPWLGAHPGNKGSRASSCLDSRFSSVT